MKLFVQMTLIFLHTLLLCNNAIAEWQKGETVYLGNSAINCYSSRFMDFNPNNNKLYIKNQTADFPLFVFDPETLSGIERIDLSYDYYNTGMFMDEFRNIVHHVGFWGISSLDCKTNKYISTFQNNFEFPINSNALSFNSESNICYYVNILPPGEQGQYLFSLEMDNMSETTKIEIPSKNSDIYGDEPYKAMYFDKDTNLLYLAFQYPLMKPPLDEAFIRTHKDSLYVFDITQNNLIKTIPVGANPIDIIKNPLTGKIYIYCIYNENNSLGKPFIISVIDSETRELVETIELEIKHTCPQATINLKDNLLYFAGNILSGKTHEVIGAIERTPNGFTDEIIYVEERDELLGINFYGKIISYDPVTGEFLRQATTGITIWEVAYFPSRNELYYSVPTQNPGTVNVLNLGDNSVTDNIEIGNSHGRLLAYSSKEILFNSTGGNISAFDLNTKNILFADIPLNTDGLVFVDMKMDENIQQLYLLFYEQYTENSYLCILDPATLEHINTVELGLHNPSGIDINFNNNNIFIKDSYNHLPMHEVDSSIVLELDGKNKSIIKRHILPAINGDEAIEIFSEINTVFIKHPNEQAIVGYDCDTFERKGSINFNSSSNGTTITINKQSHEVFVCDQSRIFIFNADSYDFVAELKSEIPVAGTSKFFNTFTNDFYTVGEGEALIQVYENPDYPGYLPPSSPPSPTTTSADASITLSWPAVYHTDVQGYKIYRSPSGADQWTKLNTELVTHTSFLDETAVPNTPYDYHVRTTGLYNISSDPSDPVTVTLTIDPDFLLSSILASQSTEQGNSIEYIITSESIEQFASLIDLMIEGLPKDLISTLSSEQLRPGEVATLTVEITEDITPDSYEFEVVGIADGIEHPVSLTLTVVETEQEESAITLSLSSKSIEFGDAMFATGRIIPAVIAPVSILFTSSSETMTVSTTSLSDGTFSIDFEPETSGEWTVLASWSGNDDFSGADSELKNFDALSGQTKITCTTDVSAAAEVGWQMTVKGTVFPNPGVGDVVLYVTKPDGTQETIDGLKINELGYYGYNITADQPGFWEVTAGWAGNSRYLGSVSETLIVPYGLDIGRAIIVVSPKQNRPFYYTANRLGNLAYQTFSKRRFDNPRIKYFDIDTTQDLNGDGFTGDVDGEPTLSNVTDAISTWAAAAVNEETPLCIYLIGEGSLDGIELSDGELLTASHLADLLSGVEATTGCDDVIVVVDAPHSGKFVSELSKLGRCVVTSTNLGKSNYIGHGKLSFSQYFLNYAYQGKSLRDSFLHTKRVLSNLPGAFKKQEPQVEGEGNLFANESSDFLKTANWYFGSSYGLQDLMPRVKSMSLASVTGQSGGVGKIVTNTHNVLSDEMTPSLKLAKSVAAQGVDVWVRVDDAESNISSVFATVFSPQDSVLTEVELFDPDFDGKYESVVYGLDGIGAYDIVAYAFDESENVSEPMKSLVMVVEREVVLEPPTDIRVDDVPGDNGYQVNVSWVTSSSEENGDVGWYRIYRSRNSELTNSIPLSQFTSIDTLKVYEENYTILVDSVAVGQTEYIDSVPMIGVNYYYWIDATGPTGSSKKIAADTPTYVEVVPQGFVVHQPYPNPFNPTTTIRYELPVESHVEFVVYDVLGRKVKVLDDRMRDAGAYDVVWDGIDREGMDVGSGMYFYQMKAGEFVRQGKMVLVR